MLLVSESDNLFFLLLKAQSVVFPTNYQGVYLKGLMFECRSLSHTAYSQYSVEIFLW